MILKGWKDIAKYLGCGVRTVQRWETLGMPVRRPSGHRRLAVVAISEEVDLWLKHGPPGTDVSTGSEAMTNPHHQFRYRVLIADNDEALLVKLAVRLADEGYDIRTARDGFEALAAMREATPDLLLSDLRMPNMSGFELLSIVRKRFPAMAVIASSSEFATAGNPSLLCDRYVQKSANATLKLLDAIRELLSQSPLRSQPAKDGATPAWFPRSINGYFVLTCVECLRSFSVMTRSAQIGKDAAASCPHCGVDVKYYIEDSVLPIQDDLVELVQYKRQRMASGRVSVAVPTVHPSTRKSGRRQRS